MYTKDNKHQDPNSPTPVTPSGGFGNPERSGRAFAGIIVLIVGSLLLARQAGADVPRFLFSFGMLLIVIGLYIGIKHRFQSWGWIIPVIIGTVFLADDFIYDFSIWHYFWPMIIIGVGLMLIFKPKRSKDWKNWGTVQDRTQDTGEDSIDATTVFGAVKKNIISKNFKGGDVTAIFGGAEIYLGQADIMGRADLDLTFIFGGAKLVVPSDWRVQTDDVVCIFGGLDDKRKLTTTAPDPNKVLVLHGTCIFGGIDIKSY